MNGGSDKVREVEGVAQEVRDNNNENKGDRTPVRKIKTVLFYLKFLKITSQGMTFKQS